MPQDPSDLPFQTLPLSRGLEAIIDNEDYEWASQYKWSAGTGSHPYPFRNDRSEGRGSAVRLHREIMQPPPKAVVDHIDGNPLNNLRSNLRIVDRRANMRNRKGSQINSTSGLLGVSRKGNKWRAQLSIDSKQYHLGAFDTPEQATEARISGELKHWGEQSAAYRGK